MSTIFSVDCTSNSQPCSTFTYLIVTNYNMSTINVYCVSHLMSCWCPENSSAYQQRKAEQSNYCIKCTGFVFVYKPLVHIIQHSSNCILGIMNPKNITQKNQRHISFLTVWQYWLIIVKPKNLYRSTLNPSNKLL